MAQPAGATILKLIVSIADKWLKAAVDALKSLALHVDGSRPVLKRMISLSGYSPAKAVVVAAAKNLPATASVMSTNETGGQGCAWATATFKSRTATPARLVIRLPTCMQ